LKSFDATDGDDSIENKVIIISYYTFLNTIPCLESIWYCSM